MPRKALALVSTLLIAVLLTSALIAAEKMTVYIRNKPYKGKTLFQKGRLYLPLQAYASALELTARQEGGGWCLNDKAHDNEKAAAGDGLTVNGKEVRDALLRSGGDVWVAAQVVTNALGGVYLENKGLGMIDIGLKYVAPPESAQMPQPNASPGATESKVVMLHWWASW